VFAIASNDLVDAGVLVIVRSARPDWPAADSILQSLAIFSRGRTANDARAQSPRLPMIGRDDD
jgi:hypothetical protein